MYLVHGECKPHSGKKTQHMQASHRDALVNHAPTHGSLRISVFVLILCSGTPCSLPLAACRVLTIARLQGQRCTSVNNLLSQVRSAFRLLFGRCLLPGKNSYASSCRWCAPASCKGCAIAPCAGAQVNNCHCRGVLSHTLMRTRYN